MINKVHGWPGIWSLVQTWDSGPNLADCLNPSAFPSLEFKCFELNIKPDTSTGKCKVLRNIVKFLY